MTPDMKEDKSMRLQSRIQSARRDATRRSSRRESAKLLGKKQRSMSSETNDSSLSHLGDSMSKLHPHEIIDLLEASAQDDLDFSLQCLRALKDSSSSSTQQDGSSSSKLNMRGSIRGARDNEMSPGQRHINVIMTTPARSCPQEYYM